MNLNSLKQNPTKLKKLNKEKLKHIIQLIDIELVNYVKASENYDEEKYQRFSVPYINGWNKLKDEVLELL